MDNKTRIFAFIALAVFSLSGCALPQENTRPSFKIIPEYCELQPGETIAFSLQGTQPPGHLKYTWSSDQPGGLISLQDGVTAEFTAPSQPGEVTIQVIVSNEDNDWVFERKCQIVSPDTPPAASPTAADTDVPPPPPTVQPSPTGQLGQVVISEVMVNVCGGDDFKRYNQYIELYNSGDAAVRVDDLWLYVPNSEYRGQRLVPWTRRNPNLTFGSGLIFDSNEIPPHGVAVILPPQYMNGPRPYRMPYDFPAGTIILTVDEDIRLGDHFYGMRADDSHHDVVVLYVGGRTAMQDMPVSTYGTPRISSKYLRGVYDDGADGIPLVPPECFSVERLDPNQSDNVHNWRYVRMGSPGEYVP